MVLRRLLAGDSAFIEGYAQDEQGGGHGERGRLSGGLAPGGCGAAAGRGADPGESRAKARQDLAEASGVMASQAPHSGVAFGSPVFFKINVSLSLSFYIFSLQGARGGRGCPRPGLFHAQRREGLREDVARGEERPRHRFPARPVIGSHHRDPARAVARTPPSVLRVGLLYPCNGLCFFRHFGRTALPQRR